MAGASRGCDATRWGQHCASAAVHREAGAWRTVLDRRCVSRKVSGIDEGTLIVQAFFASQRQIQDFRPAQLGKGGDAAEGLRPFSLSSRRLGRLLDTMKKSLAFTLLTAVLLSVSSGIAAPDLSGKYADPDNKEHWFELR